MFDRSFINIGLCGLFQLLLFSYKKIKSKRITTQQRLTSILAGASYTSTLFSRVKNYDRDLSLLLSFNVINFKLMNEPLFYEYDYFMNKSLFFYFKVKLPRVMEEGREHLLY